MNANAIGIIGSIVDAHIAGCTEPQPCDACAADREALDRLARLVEAARPAAIDFARAKSVADKSPKINRSRVYARVLEKHGAEIFAALAAVLGEEG